MNVFIIIYLFYLPFARSNMTLETDNDVKRASFLADVVRYNLKPNGWTNILTVGLLPNQFYKKINDLHLTKTVLNVDKNSVDFDDVVPHHSNVVILSCTRHDEFQNILSNVVLHPYWHSLSHIILYYNSDNPAAAIAKMFFICWYYRIINVLIVQYETNQDNITIWRFSPYVHKNSDFSYKFGCFLKNKLDYPAIDFDIDFICEEECFNVTVTSVLRAKFLGTCIGLEAIEMKVGDNKKLKLTKFFVDRGKNLKGFALRAYGFETPFLLIDEAPGGKFKLESRDGLLWATVAEKINFTIDLSPVRDYIKLPFNFERNINFVFDFGKRYADLLLIPIYQFDIVVIKIDHTFPYTDSGVCILSHRAGFETSLLNSNLFSNKGVVRSNFICFFILWFTYIIYQYVERGHIDFDHVGRALMNACRSVMSISLYRPPKIRSFRIILGVVLWGYFVINFFTQAAIISFFSAFKRGKDVDTFEEVIEKGYNLEGMASPDILLPDTEERFIKINSKIVAVPDMFTCVDAMQNDSKRFCLIDCALARFLEQNKLNDDGQQYLHVAREDHIHNYYLHMVLQEHSPLTETFNKIVIALVEGGLIKKWEQYRFNNIKEIAVIRPLRLEDLLSFFKGLGASYAICSILFFCEGNVSFMRTAIRQLKYRKRVWNITRKIKQERKLGTIKLIHTSTQTQLSTLVYK